MCRRSTKFDEQTKPVAQESRGVNLHPEAKSQEAVYPTVNKQEGCRAAAARSITGLQAYACKCSKAYKELSRLIRTAHMVNGLDGGQDSSQFSSSEIP